MQFQDLKLIAPILKALEAVGYTTPTPIQEQAIPIIFRKNDLLGCAQTGTGKTAAFAIPILQMLSYSKVKTAKKNIRALVLTPTRELAIQIEENFNQYSKDLPLKSLVVFGGVGQQPQRDALKRGVDVLIATPGRLLDLYGQGYIDLKHLEFFVLDEADRMLDMGFIHDVKKLIKIIPEKRQTLFFSATMPPEIQKLANHILVDPIKVEVTPESTTAEKIQQEVYYVKKNDKKDLLIHVLKEKNINHVLVFSKTKHGADRIVKDLAKKNIQSAAIHGNKSQSARQNALKNFKDRTLRVLVATDIAARGIDIDELAFVINYDLPNIPESYVHRIGRTGRAGKDGQAISFCDEEEYAFLLDIQKSIRMEIPLVEKHPYALHISGVAPKKAGTAKKSGRPSSTSRNGQSSNNASPGGNRRRTSSGPRSENRNRTSSRRRDS
ncbi:MULTISPECIES: DEAD/DEAH box helicase [Sphingobacterium]|uniref:DEAD/DEAH box helicase n=1 Tax=Sphingobacterium TaxID=28453 RepID=UPI000389F856|nr:MULTISPECIES: DEAD/DEAH box helicase [Sphingobacterium]KKX48791.1 DEAD/DEAH box helicase [Sphingobacterium sp. IITKGP-BTPF85]MCS3553593.1 ATP-dependent RNA helicase RhlE [Sphingobacterium sp. JUb21]MCW2260852.1 ATP-dependent RNA helicase RhlE [Sphingobacterium kitahiroshimense]NJI75623.1 DEAD/DEAH box helicase [Sphingobacterium sp. B16(2022)]TCR01566.1 ATP-dependent RNA helicase RhlE [Sphingobacterium sp. JUb20]